MSRWMFILAVALCLSVASHCSTENVRSAWIAHIQCPSETECRNVFKSLAEFKVNRVYICAWNNGKVYFESETMLKTVGKEGQGNDILGWAVKFAKEFGIPEVYAWFEYGMMASYDNLNNAYARYAQKKGWIMGKYLNFWYTDPTTLAIEFLGDIMKDAAVKYPLSGIQLDDHFDCPSVFPICNIPVMHNAAIAVWRIIRSASSMKLSLSPMPLPNSIKLSNVDWPAMLRAGLFTDVVPQFYTTSFAAFKSRIEENEQLLTDNMKQMMSCGVRVNGSGPLTEWKEVQAMLEFAREKKYGVVVWYSRGIFLDYPSQFRQFWHISEQTKH